MMTECHCHSRQLFVTDMDGTLLSTDSRVSPESAHIISDLTRRGALITVATARTPATVEPLLRSVLTSPPAIVLTGAAFWDRRAKRFVNARLMPDSLARTATEECRRAGLNPLTYTIAADNSSIDMMVPRQLTDKEQRFINERSHLQYKHIHTIANRELPDYYPRTIMIFAVGEIERIYAAAEVIRNAAPCYVSAYPDIFNRSMGFMEVFAPDVSKATAVLELKQALGAEELIVFGDNYNDIPMMRVADRAIAVGNAMPEVREAANEVIGPNSTDSVARCIASMFRS